MGCIDNEMLLFKNYTEMVATSTIFDISIFSFQRVNIGKLKSLEIYSTNHMWKTGPQCVHILVINLTLHLQSIYSSALNVNNLMHFFLYVSNSFVLSTNSF